MLYFKMQDTIFSDFSESILKRVFAATCIVILSILIGVLFAAAFTLNVVGDDNFQSNIAKYQPKRPQLENEPDPREQNDDQK